MRCIRCQSLIIQNYEEHYCYACGYRPFIRLREPEPDPRQWQPDRAPKPRNTHCKNGHAYTPENTRMVYHAYAKSLHQQCVMCAKKRGDL